VNRVLLGYVSLLCLISGSTSPSVLSNLDVRVNRTIGCSTQVRRELAAAMNALSWHSCSPSTR
jgi:hypothetical protein